MLRRSSTSLASVPRSGQPLSALSQFACDRQTCCTLVEVIRRLGHLAARHLVRPVKWVKYAKRQQRGVVDDPGLGGMGGDGSIELPTWLDSGCKD
jgi:hypothetical protein